MHWRPWRRRWRGKGRPPKPRWLSLPHTPTVFVPFPLDEAGEAPPDSLVLTPDEVEALRLVYLEGKRQGEAAELMRISRGTLWRLLESGRRKLVEAIVNRRPIYVTGSAEG